MLFKIKNVRTKIRPSFKLGVKILEDNNVVEWDGFNKFDKYVLDGNGFSFSLENKNGEKVSADGYMKWPKNYTTVKSKLDKIFNKIYKEKSS